MSFVQVLQHKLCTKFVGFVQMQQELLHSRVTETNMKKHQAGFLPRQDQVVHPNAFTTFLDTTTKGSQIEADVLSDVLRKWPDRVKLLCAWSFFFFFFVRAVHGILHKV